VITTVERARDLRQAPVWISAAAWGGGRTLYSTGQPDSTQSAARHLSRRLYSMAGVGPADFDFAELYDCFTYSVLVQLEDYGFCKKGESGPFAASGAIGRGGSIPVNTHGGFLCEGYVHGLNHVTEAVSQLRHQAGVRQVAGAELALSAAQPGYISGISSALILQRGG
jgi:acetyl-CoA acetyltransferase